MSKQIRISFFIAFLLALSIGFSYGFSLSTAYTLESKKQSDKFPFSFCLDIYAQPKVEKNALYLTNAWMGGLSAVHLAAIDLNGDKKDDLIVFDRVAKKPYCFLYENGDFIYSPFYGSLLPDIREWVQTYDYNADGKLDIFTFNGVSGISVYTNVSTYKDGEWQLQFKKLYTNLQAQMYGQYSTLYCTSVDYPALVDIDSDGAVDILNFWVPSTGDYLHYYKNYAIETYGTIDSMDFRIEDWSWGCFAESEESNVIYLDSCRPEPKSEPKSESESESESEPKSKPEPTKDYKAYEPKHSGSTIYPLPSYLRTGQSNSSTYDLLIGDFGYRAMVYLHNNGSAENAKISSFDSIFPKENPIDMESFPVVSKLSKDVIISLKEDTNSMFLCVSPYSTSPFNTQSDSSVWLYKLNTDKTELKSKSFIQNTTINEGSMSCPTFFDYNKDGLLDIVVGYQKQPDSLSFAGLSLYQNVGSHQKPEFKFITNDFLALKGNGLNEESLCPTFGDYNSDGNMGVLLGLSNGRILAFRINYENNIAVGATLTDTAFNGVKTSNYAAPLLFDYDNDSDLDLIVGSRQQMWQNENGKRYTKSSLIYYENNNGKFEHITDSLGGVDVIDRTFSNYGYSKPCFYRDKDGMLYLFCGSENGKIFTYSVGSADVGSTDVGSAQKNEDYSFKGFLPIWQAYPKEDSLFYSDFSVGIHSAPAIADLNDDGFPDLVVGNARGGLCYASGIEYRMPKPVSNIEEEKIVEELNNIVVFPNPVKDILRVETTENATYMICDINGKVCIKGLLQEGLQSINISMLNQGIYIFKAESKSGVFRGVKIIKL